MFNMGSSTCWAGNRNWMKKETGESHLGSRQLISLLPDGGCDVTSCLMLLLHLQTVGLSKPLQSSTAFCQLFCPNRKSNYDIHNIGTFLVLLGPWHTLSAS